MAFLTLKFYVTSPSKVISPAADAVNLKRATG